MFSKEYEQEIKCAFEQQMALLENRISRLQEDAAGEEGLGALRLPLLMEKKAEIERTLAQCGPEEAQALTFLYSAMPLSDLLDYPASVFMTYARHGVFLWQKGPFAGQVPERIFANYVLHHRVNNEDIVDTRGFFYDKVIGRIAGKGMEEAILETNYWCAQEGTYRSTDGRTQNARTMYGTATGRCGEESTFAVTVLRSLGIPARQIYAPLWTHCDDNHAWVEVWCDGVWRFLGACEPEERLDYGWFIGPASRAMLLHSRWFGKDEPLDPVVGKKGMCRVLNHLGHYARTTFLNIQVLDEAGEAVPGARVECQVVNHGELGLIARIIAGEGKDDCGKVRLLTGYGDLYITAYAKGRYGEAHVSLKDLKEGEEGSCEIILKSAPQCQDGWVEMDFHAPALGFVNDDTLTEEQKAVGMARNQEAAEYRERKKKSFYDAREAARALDRLEQEDRAEADEILHKAHSNMSELVRFLEWDASGWIPQGWKDGQTEHWKLEVLKALREKDWWDMKADIIRECCIIALPYAGSVPDEIFYRFLVNPRVFNEMVRPCRALLLHGMSEAEKEAVRSNPAVLKAWVDQWILSLPEQEYETLVTSPTGCLRGGMGSAHSKEVFCVNLYRALGIPARMSMMNHTVEYYRNGEFHPMTAAPRKEAVLTISGDRSLKLTEWEHYSIEKYQDGEYLHLGLWDKIFHMKGNEITVPVEPGIYRALTTNRQTNGNQLVRMMTFELKEGEQKKITLSLREIPVSAMLTDYRVGDMELSTLEGEERSLTDLDPEGKALFLWLEVSREPTEHILNELYEKKDDFAKLDTPLYVVLKASEDLEDKTLKRTMEALPMICPMLDDFGDGYRILAHSVGQEVGKLPLVLVLDGGRKCIYSDAGYNVGLADILWRILND